MFKFALFSQHSPILPIQIFAFLAVIFTVATECLATPVYPAAIDQLKSSLSGSTFCVVVLNKSCDFRGTDREKRVRHYSVSKVLSSSTASTAKTLFSVAET
ncbi:unnamed protein product [Aphanomyces euteiches]